MTYKASLDSLSKTITIAASLLVFFPVIIPLINMLQEPLRPELLAIPLLLLTLIAGLLLLCHAFAPKSYSLTKDSLIINRAIKPPVYNIRDITQIMLLDQAALRGGIRTFGSGGLFGYFGKYWHPQYGKLILYVTRSDNKILLTFRDNTKIVISPDSMEMLEELKKLSSMH